MKKKRKEEGIAVLLQEKCVSVYLVFMLFVFPLAYKNNYIDILWVKRSLFLNATFIFLVLMLLLSFFRIGEGRRRKSSGRILQLVWFLISAQMLILLLSALGAEHREDAFWGFNGRFLGSLTMLMGLAAALFIGNCLKWEMLMNWAFLAGSGIVYLLQILNTWEYDPLKMQAEAARGEQMIFISTIGNINFNAAFDGMMLPIGMVFYMICREKFSKRIYRGYLGLGFAGCIACRSDSVYLSLGAAFAVLLAVSFCEKKYLERWLEEAGVFLFAAFLMAVAARYFQIGYELDGLSLLVTSTGFLIMGSACVFAVRYLLSWADYSKERGRRYAHIWECVLILTAVFFVLCFFLINKTDLFPVDRPPFSCFYLKDSWGNHRGYVWRRCIEIFQRLPINKKLFGCGMNSPSYLLESCYGEEMVSLYQAKFIDAHNEALQFLLSIGLVGTFCYFAPLILIWAESVCFYHRGKENALFAVCAIPAFLVQGLVNGPQAATTPFLFVGIGVFFNICRTKQGGHSEKCRCKG